MGMKSFEKKCGTPGLRIKTLIFSFVLIFSMLADLFGVGLLTLRAEGAAELIFSYQTDEEGITILGFADGKQEADLVIPDTLEHEGEVLPVTRIADNAFNQKGLKSVVLGAQVTHIGQAAFINNELTSIAFPDSLKQIGDLAFADNELRSLDLNQTEEIGRSAFQTNQIENLTAPCLLRVGDEAFRANRLTEASLPDAIETFGVKVFSSNGRYVKINTKSEAVPKLESNPGLFGHVIDPAEIEIICLDQETGETIKGSEILGRDLTIEGQVYAAGLSQAIQAPDIPGYEVSGPAVLEAVPPCELSFTYRQVEEPVPELRLTEAYQGGDEIVLPYEAETDRDFFVSFVEAFDVDSSPLPAELIQVTPEVLDTAKPGRYTVTYSVSNEEGKTGFLDVTFRVESNLWDFHLGDGWFIKDFTYDGNRVTGFSEAGLEKYNDGKTALVLPHLNPYTGETVDTVGPSAFGYKSNLTSVRDFDGNIVEVSFNAFDSCGIETLSLENLKKAGSAAFRSSRLRELSLPNLEEALNRSFKNAGIENLNAPKLRSTGLEAFSGNHLGDLDLPALISAGDAAFLNAALSSVNAPLLKTAGAESFKNNQLKAVSFPELKAAGTGAFADNLIEEIKLPSAEVLPPGAFDHNMLKRIEADSLPNLTYLNYGVFTRNPLQELILPKLQGIGKDISGTEGGTPVFSPRADMPGEYGHPDYQNMVVIRCETEPAPPSTTEYLVNPTVMDVPPD